MCGEIEIRQSYICKNLRHHRMYRHRTQQKCMCQKCTRHHRTQQECKYQRRMCHHRAQQTPTMNRWSQMIMRRRRSQKRGQQSLKIGMRRRQSSLGSSTSESDAARLSAISNAPSAESQSENIEAADSEMEGGAKVSRRISSTASHGGGRHG